MENNLLVLPKSYKSMERNKYTLAPWEIPNRYVPEKFSHLTIEGFNIFMETLIDYAVWFFSNDEERAERFINLILYSDDVSIYVYSFSEDVCISFNDLYTGDIMVDLDKRKVNRELGY